MRWRRVRRALGRGDGCRRVRGAGARLEALRLRHGRRRPLVRYACRCAATTSWSRRPTSGRSGATAPAAALKYWKHKSGTPEHIDFRMTTPRGLGARLPPAPAGAGPGAGRRSHEMRSNFEEATDGAEVDAVRPHVHLGDDAPEHGRRDPVREPAARPRLDPRLQPGLHRFLQDATSPTCSSRSACRTASGCTRTWATRTACLPRPRCWRELIFPYYGEMVDFFHGYDLPVVLHTCGSTAAGAAR